MNMKRQLHTLWVKLLCGLGLAKRLFHSIGKTNPKETILTEKEYCSILTELRTELYDKGTTTR